MRTATIVFATILSSVTAIAMLSACGSNSSAGDSAPTTKPATTNSSVNEPRFSRAEVKEAFSAHGLPLLESVEPKQPSPVELLLTPEEDRAPRFQLVLFRTAADARRWSEGTDELAKMLSIPAYERPTRRANLILFLDASTSAEDQQRILAALNDV
jgi:hypothetical protein